MKLVFASDSFKGTLSSTRICELLEQAALAAWPGAQCVCLPMADGGEGTLDAIARVRAGERTMVSTHDGLMRPLVCPVFTCGDEAFVETAASCGLTLLDPPMRNPLATTSLGVGECIRHALDMGCTLIEAGHYETENPVCEVLRSALQNAADALEYKVTFFCSKDKPFGR